MNHSRLVAYVFAVALAVVLAAGAAALAPVGGGDFDLTWHTIDGGGGGSSTGGGFELAGTIGQHDAGPVMTGGTFELRGGFWPASSLPPCPADLNGDGAVGILDLLALLAAWGTDPGGPPDFDGDGTVGILDLLELLANWGDCP